MNKLISGILAILLAVALVPTTSQARYLNPNTGRFQTMDTYEGNQSDPLSLHKYVYTHCNPVNGIDPSGNGNMSYSDVGTAMLGGALLAGMFSCVADLAHRRATTVSSLAQAMSWGAVLGPYAVEVPYFAGGLGILGLNVGARTAYEVFTDKESTPVQRTAALAMVVTSIYGIHYGQLYAKNQQIALPRISYTEQPSPKLSAIGPPLPNPITVKPGYIQYKVNPRALRAGQQRAVNISRINTQDRLQQADIPRHDGPVMVTKDGVIVDGHHAARAAAEAGRTIDVLVVEANFEAGPPIMELPKYY